MSTSTVCAYFCPETETTSAYLGTASGSRSPAQTPRARSPAVTPDDKHLNPLWSKLHKEVLALKGNVKVDSSGRQLYYTAPDCVKVRRKMEVDGLVELDNREAVFDLHVKNLIDGVFHEGRDVAIFVGGNSGTSKVRLIHGDTLDPSDSGDAVPNRSEWGLAYFIIERMLQLITDEPSCEISATCAKMHLDHVADVLVSISGVRLTKSDSQKTRQQYAKLLALSKGVTLDVEEGLDGRFIVSDQLDTPIRDLSDFLHVANCFAAINAGRRTFMKLGSRHASPFHFLITLRVWRREQAPSYIHIVEMADFDWTGNEEETKAFRDSLNTVADVGAAMIDKNIPIVKSLVRDCTLTRIVHSTLNLTACDIVFFGLSSIASGLQQMDFLSRLKRAPIQIVLHGPNGEEDDSTDPELKAHVETVQKQCVELKKVVAQLESEKQRLAGKLKHGEEAISRLQQQCNIVRKLTVASSLPTKMETRTAKLVIESPSPADIQRAKLRALEKNLADMKEEDEHRSVVVRQQIKHISSEKNRCAIRTLSLQREYEALHAKLDELEARTAHERRQREAEMNARITEIIEKNRIELENRNSAIRSAIQTALQKSVETQEREVLREKTISDELQLAAKALNITIQEENEKWSREQLLLEQQLNELVSERVELERELHEVSVAHTREIAALDAETKAMSEYAHKLTAALVRFECHNSSESRRILTMPRANIPLYDPSQKYTVNWFRRRCEAVRKWLDDRGYPRHLAFCDYENGRVEIFNVEESKYVKPPECKSAGTMTDPIVEKRVAKDFTVAMSENLSRQNRDLEIALQAKQRLEKFQAEKSASRSKSRTSELKSLKSWKWL